MNSSEYGAPDNELYEKRQGIAELGGAMRNCVSKSKKTANRSMIDNITKAEREKVRNTLQENAPRKTGGTK